MTDALLPWQPPAAAEWLARRGRWPHAVLVAGPAGIGKRVLADWLARTLLCEQPAADGAPCGECPSCRYASGGHHPDLRIVEPVDDDGENPKPVEWIVVDRIRRATKGKSDVLILTTAPAIPRWETMAELAGACRKAAKDRNAGIADLEKAFHTAGMQDRERLYFTDKVHLGKTGHELVADTVLKALAAGGR